MPHSSPHHKCTGCFWVFLGVLSNVNLLILTLILLGSVFICRLCCPWFFPPHFLWGWCHLTGRRSATPGELETHPLICPERNESLNRLPPWDLISHMVPDPPPSPSRLQSAVAHSISTLTFQGGGRGVEIERVNSVY